MFDLDSMDEFEAGLVRTRAWAEGVRAECREVLEQARYTSKALHDLRENGVGVRDVTDRAACFESWMKS